jgi:TRAP-type C4-dicarboxylate transport system substrate-binding protein
MQSGRPSAPSPCLLPSRPARGMRRRAVLAAAGLAAPFLPRFARAAAFTWRLGHTAPVDFPLQVRLVEAAATIASRSEGQMAVEIYADGQLGSAVGLLAQVRAGTIDAASLTSQVLAKDLPVAALPMVGFAFAGTDRLWPALDGGAGGFVRAQIKERLGLVAMDRCWDFGFRQITTGDKAVNSAADMVGLRLRTPPEADFIGLFQALKALPVAVPLNSLATALGSHAVDGQDSVLPLVQAAGLFRVQSLCALTNHVWDGEWICVSGNSWSKLPAKLKDIVAAALNESGLRQRQDTADADVKMRKGLEAAGMKFNTVDPRGFRSVLRTSGYYAAWQTRMGDDAWAALEKYTGRLG